MPCFLSSHMRLKAVLILLLLVYFSWFYFLVEGLFLRFTSSYTSPFI